MPDLGCWGGTICAVCPPGGHMPLRCKNHPELKWSTKNIGYIGARNLYYNLSHEPGMGPECSCTINELFHDHARDGVEVIK